MRFFFCRYFKDPTPSSVPSTPTRDTSQHPLTPNPISVSRRITLSNNSSFRDDSQLESNIFIRQIHSPNNNADPRNVTPRKILLRTTPTTARHDFTTPVKQTGPFDRSTGSTINNYPSHHSHHDEHTPGSASNKSHERSNTSRKIGSTPISLSDFMHTPASTPNRKFKQKKQDLSPLNLSFDTEFPKMSSPHQVTSSTPTQSPQPIAIKPKRRVVPIKLPPTSTSSASAFCSPAFQTDNNLIGIGCDFEELSISRDMLRTHKALIAQDFERNESETDKLMAIPRNQPSAVSNVDSFVVDLTKVTEKIKLDQMAAIYGALLNLNLSSNILTDISYMLNMLNADYGRCKVDVSNEIRIWDSLFANGQNCIYFCLAVLRSQTQLLLMLDLTTLKVLVQNERLVKCDASIHNLLTTVYEKRLQNSANQSGNRQPDKSSSLNVSYQQDIDTKNNFPTTREFSAFNKQRDVFYQILR